MAYWESEKTKIILFLSIAIASISIYLFSLTLTYIPNIRESFPSAMNIKTSCKPQEGCNGRADVRLFPSIDNTKVQVVFNYRSDSEQSLDVNSVITLENLLSPSNEAEYRIYPNIRTMDTSYPLVINYMKKLERRCNRVVYDKKKECEIDKKLNIVTENPRRSCPLDVEKAKALCLSQAPWRQRIIITPSDLEKSVGRSLIGNNQGISYLSFVVEFETSTILIKENDGQYITYLNVRNEVYDGQGISKGNVIVNYVGDSLLPIPSDSNTIYRVEDGLSYQNYSVSLNASATFLPRHDPEVKSKLRKSKELTETRLKSNITILDRLIYRPRISATTLRSIAAALAGIALTLFFELTKSALDYSRAKSRPV